MFEFAAFLAFIAAIIIGVSKGYHKEGGGGMIAFLLMYGIAFVVIVAIFALVALLEGRLGITQGQGWPIASEGSQH